MSNNFSQAIRKINESENFKEWEPGDQQAYMFNDGVIIISLSKERECNINVIAGDPIKFDMNLNMLD